MYIVTLGVIVGNQGFFPDHLCGTGKQEVLSVLAEVAYALNEALTKYMGWDVYFHSD